MSSCGEIRSVLKKFNQALNDTDASEVAAEWQSNLFHATEVEA